MTHQRLAAARRMMARHVLGALPAGAPVDRLAPVSFSLLDFDEHRLIFRLVDRQGRLLDLDLNPVVAAALRDCAVMTAYLPDTPPPARPPASPSASLPASHPTPRPKAPAG